MLSHLRFHRRGPSNPSSPAPDQSSPSSLQSHQQSPLNPDSASPLDVQQPSPASASLPPTLPPIARVTSSDLDLDPLGLGDKQDVDKQSPPQPQQQPQPVSRPAQPQRSGYSAGSSFIGGVALRNYQRNAQAQQVDGDGQTSPKKADPPSRPSPQTSSSSKGIASLSINNLAGSSSSSQRHSGSRPPGESLPSSSVLNIEPLKGKKGLPFLKNPMSTLLLRRKNHQSLSSDLPLPLGGRLDEPTYDPRIKGTRVHDFSAPRRRTNAPATDTVAIRSASLANIALESGVGPLDGAENRGSVALVDGQLQRRMMSSASDPARPESGSTNSHTIAQSSSVSSVRTGSSTAEQAFPLEENVVRELTMKNNDPALQAAPSAASSAIAQDVAIPARDTGSIHITRSRNVSLSSIPRHMKSTSSRFSFDMIGAAKQEKLLEERHRQRELDKKAAEGEPRDSRFDEFDEDSFDYDAMMDDDGLEEKIPGINADYEEEDIPYLDGGYDEQEAQYIEDDIDPDDDQENFAGFTFQRSNATSSLTSPQSLGVFPTPRDTEGEVIGCAMTKDSPGLSLPPSTPAPPSQGADAEGSGLGIHGVDAVSDSLQTLNLEAGPVPPAAAAPLPEPVRRKMSYDDLYFDEGMAGFGGVFAEDLAAGPPDDGEPFDESIFDNDDTDRFGRPFPGAFAAAKLALKEKVKQEDVPQERDEEEPIVDSQQQSEQQDFAQAETQASTSISPEHADGNDDNQSPDDLPPLSETTIVAPQPTAYSANPIAAYQAALAAAAQKAAASGEFERSLAQSPTDADNNGLPHYAYDDYGYSYDDMDDFEMDDDAIIAEANASALANDYDGWYGQEFGFYAAPVNNYGSHNASSGSEDNAYVAGGFFGPKGASNINRSKSGRVVSREPNLTPITERSEYSNRNSLMSLGMPPISGTPVVQSPGLAQLAMMADRGDEQMNLTALLRLRSKAWGGSQASLASSKDGSPRSERGDVPGSPRGPGFPAGFPSSIGHTRKNSAFSVVSRDSESGSAPASPTLTMPTSALAFSSSAQPDYVNPDTDVASAWAAVSASPVQMGSNMLQEGISPLSDARCPPAFAAPGAHPHAMSSSQTATSLEKGHQRQKGSTDSISYMMEEEESGETRWILERRRTGEFGEVEILEREVVEGGRI
ncbi:hypothetical protein BBK36DRAFT_152169 [Trichoderma citrinoviride]|uniref:AGC-kinase C-terminal domain-containing protein n=1 Tax=Trichoderma citrinoviride TaxID=58853 RepID=A0A2T4BLD6_9HYPO|nr:hypothetical protein BBK36DRAFT_152169 [Trichoderma citrinoviride]PTB70080.1 hypothetical protein BBK36DRAFT_152169 [Trichoderma citrinoviride]